MDGSLHFQTDDGLRKNISQNDVQKREKKGIEHEIPREAEQCPDGPARPNAEGSVYTWTLRIPGCYIALSNRTSGTQQFVKGKCSKGNQK